MTEAQTQNKAGILEALADMDEAEIESQGEVRETEFPAVVAFDEKKSVGMAFWGRYRGVEKVPQKDGRILTAHVFEYAGSTKGLAFKRGADRGEIVPNLGDLVSIAGQRLDRALPSEIIGLGVYVKYLGREGKGNGGKAPAHLFEVRVLKSAA
jgi:hypothetical protein